MRPMYIGTTFVLHKSVNLQKNSIYVTNIEGAQVGFVARITTFLTLPMMAEPFCLGPWLSRLALPIANCAIGEMVSHLAKKNSANLAKRFYSHINGAMSCKWR